ncbi:MAG: endonuclease/exonuclease/phosphatase family protein [Leptospiraceae bacterium]|nr:endonuclease/exonuclease/phosphatase family protein [Leptospiraceae bacterium]
MDPVALPSPGEFTVIDFRPRNTAPQSIHANLRIASWNIERGYQLEGIIKTLQQCRAHIILLQEVDWLCERTGNKNILNEIAVALSMQAVYGVEFRELHSPRRTPRLQGGGVHGNAILSCFDLDAPRCHVYQHKPFVWHHSRRYEPREGARNALLADCDTPWGKVSLACTHLENRCGMPGRLRQLQELLEQPEMRSGPLVIGGDLNTLAHGIARLHPVSWDPWTWRFWGRSEGSIWEQLLSDPRSLAPLPAGLDGLPDLVRGLRDPFDSRRDITFRKFGGIYRARLDWLLGRGLQWSAPGRLAFQGSERYSDHTLVMADAKLQSGVL